MRENEVAAATKNLFRNVKFIQYHSQTRVGTYRK